MLAAARAAGWAVGNDVGVEYVSRVPGPPLDGLIDDLYYLEGAPPYSPVDAAGGARAIAHRQPRGAASHPRRHRRGRRGVRRRLRGHHAHACVGVQLPNPDPVRGRPLQAVGPGTFPSDARGQPGTPRSGGGSCAIIPTMSSTAGRSQPIVFVQERPPAIRACPLRIHPRCGEDLRGLPRRRRVGFGLGAGGGSA